MKTHLALLVLLLLIIKPSFSQTTEKYKAVHIYRLAQNINWRLPSKPDKYVITVFGKSTLSWELNNVAKSPKATRPQITVQKALSLDNLKNSHIVYISKSKSSLISDVVEKLEGHKTLIITDNLTLCAKGIDINFILKNNQLKLEIDKGNIEQKGLLINEALIASNFPCN